MTLEEIRKLRASSSVPKALDVQTNKALPSTTPEGMKTMTLAEIRKLRSQQMDD